MTIKDFLYYLVDRITLGRGIRRKIQGRSISFPPKWSRYYENNYEKYTFGFFDKFVREGDTILDIGAHIGLFAVVGAKIVGHGGTVYSFEPTPYTRSVLKEVVELNKVADIVKVRDEAVTDSVGVITFWDTGDRISNANSTIPTERMVDHYEIPCTTIDAFVEQNHLYVNCIKIDVEGAELNLLRGAQKTLERCRPILRLGLHPQVIVSNKQSLADVWNLLTDHGYVFEFEDERVDEDWFLSQNNLFDVTLRPV